MSDYSKYTPTPSKHKKRLGLFQPNRFFNGSYRI